MLKFPHLFFFTWINRKIYFELKTHKGFVQDTVIHEYFIACLWWRDTRLIDLSLEDSLSRSNLISFTVMQSACIGWCYYAKI